MLETAAIKLTKKEMLIGVNTKEQDRVPHDKYAADVFGAIYAVPVWPKIKTQDDFKKVYVSYYFRKLNNEGGICKCFGPCFFSPKPGLNKCDLWLYCDLCEKKKDSEWYILKVKKKKEADDKLKAEKKKPPAKKVRILLAKRLEQLNQIINALSIVPVLHAFQYPTNRNMLNKLQRSHKLPQSNSATYLEMRVILFLQNGFFTFNDSEWKLRIFKCWPYKEYRDSLLERHFRGGLQLGGYTVEEARVLVEHGAYWLK